jgi:hypothetical protein
MNPMTICISNYLAAYGSLDLLAVVRDELLADPELATQCGVNLSHNMLFMLWPTETTHSLINLADLSRRHELLLRYWWRDDDYPDRRDPPPRCWVDGVEVDDT